MAIPGSKPKLDVHAKVKIGIKKRAQNGREYPAAVDYFVSDAPEFAALVGDKPNPIRIRLIHGEAHESFSSGLEWWIKDKNKRPLLACYTKDGGDNPVALRLGQMLDPDDVLASEETVGQGRRRIRCRARACPHMQKRDGKQPDCRPMGRLVFVLDGDPLKHVYELDTKAWNSIEALEGALKLAQTSGPLAGRLFELSVRIEKKGGQQFPVLSIKEIAERDPETAKAVATAEAVIADEQAQAEGADLRTRVIRALEASGRDPRSPAVAEWVKRHGLEEALRRLTGGAA